MAITNHLSPESLKVRANAQALGHLFDLIETSFLFVKDRDHRFVRCNRALWTKYGLSGEHEMLGKTDADFHPLHLAKAYVKEDQKVMETRKPVVDAVWLVPSRGILEWYRCSKIPISETRNGKETVIGIAGILQLCGGTGLVPPEYDRIKPALILANTNYRTGVRVAEMARKSGYSLNQFTRIFQQLFHMKPVEYIRRLRLEDAAKQLRSSPESICNVAQICGYYDQSAFSKAFKDFAGISPKDYRKQFGRPSSRSR